MHCCLFVKVLCCISRRNSDIISCVLSFVNIFFIFFWDFLISSPPLFRGGILSYHPVRSLSTPFLYCSVEILFDHSPGRKKGILSVSRFIFILIWNGERGIWTLAPRERPTPLAGAPLQPLEYFSKFQSEWHPLPIFYCASSLTRVLLYKNLLALSMHFTLFLNIYVFTIQSSSVSSGALTVVDYTRSYQNSPESLKQWIFVSNYCQISQKYLLYVLYALHQFLPKRDIGYMPNFLPKFFGYFTMFLQKEIIIKR